MFFVFFFQTTGPPSPYLHGMSCLCLPTCQQPHTSKELLRPHASCSPGSLQPSGTGWRCPGTGCLALPPCDLVICVRNGCRARLAKRQAWKMAPAACRAELNMCCCCLQAPAYFVQAGRGRAQPETCLSEGQMAQVPSSLSLTSLPNK